MGEIRKMQFNRQRVKSCLEKADFRTLFIEELGWDKPPSNETVTIDGNDVALRAIAEKRGLVAFLVEESELNGKLDNALRRKIDNALGKYVHEHLIIFLSKGNSRQQWQWIRREKGKTAALRTEIFQTGQSGERLIQKLGMLYVSLNEEASFTLSDATSRVKAAFDIEKVTKKFYEEFKKKHDSFLKFIDGIPDDEFRRWYASVMLNRLMFIYFLQKKGFLDIGNLNYLKSRLDLIEKSESNFYRDFLCPLFFEGFAKKEQDRSETSRKLLGKIPYLNGGLFTKHQIEEKFGSKIEISNVAFKDLFEFFEKYQWHLDEKSLQRDNEINPDVLGYIFEKYINQKQMGAYYTKEDITDYISNNTIIPWLFNATAKKCKIAFEPNSYLWGLVSDDKDRYIYKAAKHGITYDALNDKPIADLIELPGEVFEGIKDVSRRNHWNKTANEDCGLPTETWREVISRRNKYDQTIAAILNGEINEIDQFITFNLDIKQFARDSIQYAEGPEYVRAFWQSLQKVKVLDPACGSGAFLFAALNVLEDLYDACLERMQAFIDDLDSSEEKAKTSKYSDFREILDRIASHPNRHYFIYKTIIVQNLYGVDIMEEATEICKLRLFLKLASQLETADKIEPLPDIDFNIKAGNSLIGYTSFDDVQKAIDRNGFDFSNVRQELQDEAEKLDKAFALFRQQQTELGGEVTVEDKLNLKNRLSTLEERLNNFLAKDYGIDNSQPDLVQGAKFEGWKSTHKPFHWLIEFYGIVNDGGFDVILGNPPYLELREVDYKIIGLKTIDSKAIHVMFIEKSIELMTAHASISMIVPLALVSTQRMKIAQDLLELNRTTWYANYSWRPGKLFDTVNRALTIFISNPKNKPTTYSTNYQKWNSESRSFLMQNLNYISVPKARKSFYVPKLGHAIEAEILRKLYSSKSVASMFISRSDNRIFYRTTGGLYWKVFTNFSPKFFHDGKAGKSSRETTLTVSEKQFVYPMIAALSSSLFWYWYTITSNLRDLNPTDIYSFPLPLTSLEDKEISNLGQQYVTDLEKNSVMLTRQQKKTGKAETQSFKILKSKNIIDLIDEALARHYGFNEEELDFIINYDIKYRMGAEEDNDVDE